MLLHSELTCEWRIILFSSFILFSSLILSRVPLDSKKIKKVDRQHWFELQTTQICRANALFRVYSSGNEIQKYRKACLKKHSFSKQIKHVCGTNILHSTKYWILATTLYIIFFFFSFSSRLVWRASQMSKHSWCVNLHI